MTKITDIPERYDDMQDENGEYIPGENDLNGLRLDINPPRKSDEYKILDAVYNEMTRNEKNTLGRMISRKAIKAGKESLAAEMLDPLYNDAKEEVSELYSRVYRNFIGLYTYQDGKPSNLVGFTSIPGMVEIQRNSNEVIEEGPFIVYDVFATDADGYKTDSDSLGRYDMVYGIYDVLFDRVEKIAKSTMGGDEVEIDFRSFSITNGTLWSVLTDRGYDIANSPDLHNQYRFTKMLKKREDVNEGNNSR